MSLAARNPFRIHGTDLAPGALLAAKLVALVFAVQGLWRLTDPFVPYLSLFDHVGDPTRFQHVLQALWLVAAAALFLNLVPRVACGVLGGTLGVALLSSDAFRTNNLTYTALFFLLIALSTRGTLMTFLRWQLAVLYALAAANKLLDRGWRNGSFFETWNSLNAYGSVYRHVAHVFPGRSFSAGLSWGVIVIEFLLALAFVLPRTVPLGAWAVVAYHSSLLLLAGSTFTMFWYALVATAIALLWPAERPEIRFEPAQAWVAALRALDLGRAVVWGRGAFSVEVEGVRHSGRDAVARTIALQPLLYALVFVLMAAPQDPDRRFGALLAFAFVGTALFLRLPRLRAAHASPALHRA
jgi:hypothetical protein